MMQRLYGLNKWILFTTLTLATVYFTWLMNAALPFEQMMYSSLSEQLSANRIEKLIENQQKWQWLSYAIVPVLLLIKWLLVAVVLDIGALFLEIELKFKKAFHIAMLSEVVFIVLLATKFGWFFYHRDILTLEYVQFFMPLSLGNVIDISFMDKWLVYPLQVFNVFEMVYWLTLAYFLHLEIKQSFWKSFHFVAITYGVGLVVWLTFIAFLILNFN